MRTQSSFTTGLWSAKAPGGRSVGWLWVKPIDDMPATSLYLEQITVAAGCRRQGYGRAMLEALESFSPLRVSRRFAFTSTWPTSLRRPSMQPRAPKSLGRNDVKISLRKRLPGKSG